jgi:hypothetical protein
VNGPALGRHLIQLGGGERQGHRRLDQEQHRLGGPFLLVLCGIGWWCKWEAAAVSIDGVYGFVYCGAVDLGIGAFIIENGNVRGRDYGGLNYSGTAVENPDETITLKVVYHVPAGGILVQGVTPQEVPYDKIIEQNFPRLFNDGRPVSTASPPVTVMIRRLPPSSRLPQALGLQ